MLSEERRKIKEVDLSVKRSDEISHKGHRERLKRQFRATGLEHLDDYRVLELLLFYAIPQIDTNPLAHRLIDRFGSLAGVFDASFDELYAVEGIGENAATLIKLIPSAASYYLTSTESHAHKKYDTAEAVGKFLVNLYIGVSVETIYLLLLNNKHELIDTIKVHEGSVNSVSISPRRLIEPAIFKRASMVILAHNHPGGVAIPSSEDIHTTCTLKDSFDLVGITMLEHFVVAGNRYAPILIKCGGVLCSQHYLQRNFYSPAMLEGVPESAMQESNVNDEK